MNKHSLVCLVLGTLLLTACGEKAEYTLKPSGTYETASPVIHLPEVKDTTLPTERFNTFLTEFNQPDIVMKFTYNGLDETGTNREIDFFVAYRGEYSFVRRKNLDTGLETTVLSNSDKSYLMDEILYTASEADKSVFMLTSREDVQFLKDFEEYVLVETDEFSEKYKNKAGDLELSVEYAGGTSVTAFTLTRSDATQISVRLNEPIELCDTDDYFKITSDYTVVDYEGV